MRRQFVILTGIVIVAFLIWTYDRELSTKQNKIGILMVNRMDVQKVCNVADVFNYVYRIIVIEDNIKWDIDTCIHSAADQLTDCDTIMIVDKTTNVEKCFQQLRNHEDPGNLLNKDTLLPRNKLRTNLDWRTVSRFGKVPDEVQWVTCL